MKQKLYLVRHGQTQFNLERRVQGWCDSPLTPLGRSQARTAGAWFRQNGIRFDQVYSSDSKRAMDTARIISSFVPAGRIQPRQRLREMSWGKYDGAPLKELAHIDIDAGMKEYGGETRKEAASRVLETILSIMKKPGHGSVLVVSHSIPINTLMKTLPRAKDVSIPKYIGNGAVLEYDVIGSSFLLTRVFDPLEGTPKEKV